MAIPSYYRELRRFLMEAYGVVDIRFEYASTGHPRWSFDYDGQSHTVTLQGATARRETNALDMKKADLRRLLGPPRPPSEPRRKRSLEDMMPTIEAKPFVSSSVDPRGDRSSLSHIGRLACYMTGTGKIVLEFHISLGGMEEWDRGRVNVIELGAEDWKISRDPEGRKLTRIGNKWIRIQIIGGTIRERFGISPADIVEVDGALMFHCPTATRVPVSAIHRKSLHQKPDAVEPTPALAAATTHMRWSADELRDLLNSVRRMEASTPYRVSRLPDGSLAFSAPTIK